MTPFNATAIRLGVFLAVLAIMALWEAVAPRRFSSYSRVRRWLDNLALVAVMRRS
jgi:hypothetical protein